MKCKIENCKFESNDLSRHILYIHDMTFDEYRIKYNEIEIIDKNLKNKRVETRKKNYLFICPMENCNKKFASDSALQWHIKLSKDAKHSHLIYNETNQDDWVECNICTMRKSTIKKHILEHNLNLQSYTKEIYSINYKKQLLQKQKEKQNAFEFSCNYCTEKFSTKKALDRHLIQSKEINHNHLIYNETNQNDWVECKICGFRKIVIIDHLKTEHKLTSDEYKKLYNTTEIWSKNYSENQLRNFILAGTNATRKEKQKLFECHICQQKFNTKNQLECHIEDIQDEHHSHYLFNELNIDSWIECKICKYRSARIDFHIKKIHKLTLQQYQGEYLSKSFLEKAKINGKINHESEQLQGQNNPFYGKNHSEKTKQQISQTLLNRKDHKKATIVLSQQIEKFNNQKEDINEILRKL